MYIIKHAGNHNDTHLNVSGPKTKEAAVISPAVALPRQYLNLNPPPPQVQSRKTANLLRQKAAAPNPSQGLHLKRKVTPAQNPLPVKKNPPASLVAARAQRTSEAAVAAVITGKTRSGKKTEKRIRKERSKRRRRRDSVMMKRSSARKKRN